MSNMPLELHLTGVLVHKVQENELATHWRNDVPVLATPVLLWLAELAAMRAIESALQPGQMTLGFAHDMRHLAPTPVGWTITLEAKLEKIDGRFLSFHVEGRDEEDVILSGTHTRAIVERGRFVAHFEAKRERHDQYP